MKKSRKTDAFDHLLSWPRLTDSAQDHISKSQGMEGTIITRSTLAITKLPCNTTCGVVRAMAKPNQRNTVVFEDAVDHA